MLFPDTCRELVGGAIQIEAQPTQRRFLYPGRGWVGRGSAASRRASLAALTSRSGSVRPRQTVSRPLWSWKKRSLPEHLGCDKAKGEGETSAGGRIRPRSDLQGLVSSDTRPFHSRRGALRHPRSLSARWGTTSCQFGDHGQVGFRDESKVFKCRVEKNNMIVNGLNRTKREEYPDLAAIQEERAKEHRR